jgi:hypothetical protein
MSICARNYRPSAHVFSHGSPIGSLLLGRQPRKANRFGRIISSPPYGVPFFGQRDLFLIRALPQYIRPPANLNGLVAEAGSIIVAAAGQSGESTIFGQSELGSFFAGGLVSEHTLHLLVDPEKISHEYFFAVLHSAWGEAALKSCATGTSVPSLDATLLCRLRIPRFGESVEAKIAAAIHRAYSARKAADAAEAEAIRIIEEEVLPAWLA